MNGNMTVALELIARGAGMRQGLTTAQSDVSKFAANAKREMNALKGTFNSLASKVAALGVSFSVVQQAIASAKLDKSLTQIGQTAGTSVAQVTALRSSLFTMATQTGQSVEDLQQGFNNLVQSGLGWKESLETIRAINTAMAVTGANANTLSSGLSVAATAFQFDLSKPGKALELLDRMTVAGRLGNAELENLSDIFARVGVDAQAAGMGFDKTLAFVETLSMIERQPERLATLSHDVLRMFTNLQYAAQAQQASGVRFFDPKTGARRDPVAVLADFKKKFDALKTEAQKASFVQAVLGQADEGTKKGFRTLLQGEMLDKVKEFTGEIEKAGGTLKKDLPDAIDNAVAQVGRLKGALRNAFDDAMQPVNKTIANVIAWTMAPKEEGGLGLSGKDMLGWGAAGTAATVLAAKFGNDWIGKMASRLLGHGSSVSLGVAEGKALEATMGITPVFVVNWPAAMSAVGIPGGGATPWHKKLPAIATGMSAPLGWTATVVGAGYGSIEVGKALSEFQASHDTTAHLEELRARHMVMGGGPNSYQVKLIDAELASRVLQFGSNPSWEEPIVNVNMKVNIDRDDRVYTESGMNTNVQIDIPRGQF